MRFCQEHWDTLRAEVTKQGLAGFVADSGEDVAKKMVREVEEKEVTIDSFDPLMGAHWAIVGNLADIDGNIFFIDECPLCYSNKMHFDHCQDPDCPGKGQSDFFDRWIEYAVQDQLKVLEELRK